MASDNFVDAGQHLVIRAEAQRLGVILAVSLEFFSWVPSEAPR